MRNVLRAAVALGLGFSSIACDSTEKQAFSVDIMVDSVQFDMSKDASASDAGNGVLIQGSDVAGSGARVMLVGTTEGTGSSNCTGTAWISYTAADGTTYSSTDGAPNCFYTFDAEHDGSNSVMFDLQTTLKSSAGATVAVTGTITVSGFGN